MTGRFCSTLEDRALLRVGGPEAEHFLENLVTCRIEGMKAGEAAFGGLLTPQGKILFDFFVIARGDDYLVDVAADKQEELAKRLTFYKLRAKVEIEAVQALHVSACWGEEPAAMESAIIVADPRLKAMGWRIYSEEPPNADGDYDAHRIGLGMPEGGKDFAFGDAFPHETLMDQNGGVDFAKGCFVGQEVVSRMQHRGTARKRLIMVEAQSDLPDPGSEILAGGKPAGAVATSQGPKGLAMLRLDRAKEAFDRDELLMAAEIPIAARLQPWVRFSWPE